MYDPEMGNSPFGDEAPAQSNPMDAAKGAVSKYGKTIVIIAIVAGVAFFGYDYFVGSLVKTTIEARNTEGQLLNDVTGSLFEGSSTSALQSFSGSTTLDLRPGTYRVEWDVDGTPYDDPGPENFTIEKSETREQTQKTELEEELGVSVSAAIFPSILVVGKTAKGSVTLQNDTSTGKTVELAFDKDLKIFDITPEQSSISVPPNGKTMVTLTIVPKVGTVVKNKKSGDTKNGEIRVKFTREGRSIQTLLFDKFDFDVSGLTGTWSAKSTQLSEKTITIRNTNAIDSPEKINAEIFIDSAQNNPKADIMKWFQWNLSPPFEPVEKGQTLSVGLQVNAPATADSDTVTGRVKFSTSFWEKTLPFTLKMEGVGIQVVATLDNLTTKKFSIKKDASGLYQFQTATLKIENKSPLPIESILYALEDCSTEYISPVDDAFFTGLSLAEKGKPGAIKSTTLKINAPSTALPGAEQFCKLQLTFLNPKTGDAQNMDPVTAEIDT